MKHTIQNISYSKKGLKRDRNQDRFFIYQNDFFHLFIVFDGVSSYPESYVMINYFKRLLKKNVNSINHDGSNLGELLYVLNTELVNTEIQGASTLAAVFIAKDNDFVKIINVGDSRVYRFTNQFIEKVTKDDSLTSGSNVITKYLGADFLIAEDFKVKIIKRGCNLLLCTDGFYSLMEKQLKVYFETLNFKKLGNMKAKFSHIQRKRNLDDSTFIVIKDEVSSRD